MGLFKKNNKGNKEIKRQVANSMSPAAKIYINGDMTCLKEVDYRSYIIYSGFFLREPNKYRKTINEFEKEVTWYKGSEVVAGKRGTKYYFSAEILDEFENRTQH